MTEPSIAPHESTAWYRAWWLDVGKKFVLAGLAGLFVVNTLSILAALAIWSWWDR